jgi:hypothetical protein
MENVLVFLVVTMVINGQEFERREKVLNIESCFRVASERSLDILNAHNEELSSLKVTCEIKRGDPVLP